MINGRKSFKRFIATLLALVMCLGTLQVAVFADEDLQEYSGDEVIELQTADEEIGDGEQPEDEQLEDEQSEGEQPEDEQSEDEQSDGEQSEGEQPEDEQSEDETNANVYEVSTPEEFKAAMAEINGPDGEGGSFVVKLTDDIVVFTTYHVF